MSRYQEIQKIVVCDRTHTTERLNNIYYSNLPALMKKILLNHYGKKIGINAEDYTVWAECGQTR